MNRLNETPIVDFTAVPRRRGDEPALPISFSDLARVNNLDTITAGRSPGQNL